MKGIHDEIRAEMTEAFARVYDRGDFILGSECEQFDKDYAAYCETKYATGISNGLDALKLILLGLGVGAGDEVIVPANSFIATALAVTEVGATVVFADVSEKTYNLTAETVKPKITEKTKAVIVVHLYGQISGMSGLKALCAETGVQLIEDAAQAHGARYNGQRAGAFGVGAAFSFYPAKNLGALGDGGAIATNSEALFEKVRVLRNYGSRVKYSHEALGFNCRLDELQAAFLRIKLRHLDQWTQSRRVLAAEYLKKLDSTQYQLPVVETGSEPVWHVFCVQVKDRARIQTKLRDAGVPTLIHYPTPIHLQSAYAFMGHKKGDFEVSEHLAEHCLSLPIWPGLDVEQVILRANEI
jgi:dTDP-4-amino-4,6-dideoxygalactose transaminase